MSPSRFFQIMLMSFGLALAPAVAAAGSQAPAERPPASETSSERGGCGFEMRPAATS